MKRMVLKLPEGVIGMALLAACSGPARAPERATEQGVAERLGYAPSARLLILHADDVGMSAGTNRASIKALERDWVTSASVLPVASSFDAATAAALANPSYDVGVHLSLVSESPAMRWRPATASPHLVDGEGFLPLDVDASVDTSAAESELMAQVARARDMGIVPTHLDSHHWTLYNAGPALFRVWRRVAQRTCLLIPIAEPMFADLPYLREGLRDGHPLLTDMIVVNAMAPPTDWLAFYTTVLDSLRPGLTMLVVHPGERSAEERAAFREHTVFSDAWRARDMDVVASPAFREALTRSGVELVTWREVGNHYGPCAASRRPAGAR